MCGYGQAYGIVVRSFGNVHCEPLSFPRKRRWRSFKSITMYGTGKKCSSQ